jgi:hypothetical protein
VELPREIASGDRAVPAEGEGVSAEQGLQSCRQVSLGLGFCHAVWHVDSDPTEGIDQSLEVEEPGDEIPFDGETAHLGGEIDHFVLTRNRVV